MVKRKWLERTRITEAMAGRAVTCKHRCDGKLVPSEGRAMGINVTMTLSWLLQVGLKMYRQVVGIKLVVTS